MEVISGSSNNVSASQMKTGRGVGGDEPPVMTLGGNCISGVHISDTSRLLHKMSYWDLSLLIDVGDERADTRGERPLHAIHNYTSVSSITNEKKKNKKANRK